MAKTDPITIRFDETEMAGIKQLSDRTRLPVAEIVRRLCEFAFAKTKIAGDISWLLEPTESAVREGAAEYMPTETPRGHLANVLKSKAKSKAKGVSRETV